MSNLGKLFEDVGDAFFKAETPTVTQVYVDLEYIQDLKLGAILNRISVPQEMQYIQAMLPKYNNRYDLLTAKYFPVLKYTEEDLLNDLNDPNKIERICLIAPWTAAYYGLLETIDMFKQHNAKLTDTIIPIKLTINISDVSYPVLLQKKLKLTIENLIGIEVEIVHQKRYTYEQASYLEYQVMFIYDYGLFVNQLPTAFVGEGKFSNTKIIAPPYIQSELGHKTDDYEFVLRSTEKGMDIYCDFLFLRNQIPLTK